MRTSLFLITILAIFAWASAIRPNKVTNANSQCQLANHVGACFEQKIKNLSNICKHLKCASKTQNGNRYVPALMGPALPGTICGISKMCNDNKQCVSTLNVPQQVGPNELYECVQ